MTWREVITNIYAARPLESSLATRPVFNPGATAKEIAAAEDVVRTSLPESLRSLLLESNGVMEQLAIDGGDWFDSRWLLWTSGEISEHKHRHRDEAVKPATVHSWRDVLFFTGAGTDGILFGFPIDPDGCCASHVVAWEPIEDTLTEVASSLESFVRGWLTDSLTF